MGCAIDKDAPSEWRAPSHEHSNPVRCFAVSPKGCTPLCMHCLLSTKCRRKVEDDPLAHIDSLVTLPEKSSISLNNFCPSEFLRTMSRRNSLSMPGASTSMSQVRKAAAN